MKRYLEVTSGTYVEASEAFDRLKTVRRILRNLKGLFESASVTMSAEEMDALKNQYSTSEVTSDA